MHTRFKNKTCGAAHRIDYVRRFSFQKQSLFAKTQNEFPASKIPGLVFVLCCSSTEKFYYK